MLDFGKLSQMSKEEILRELERHPPEAEVADAGLIRTKKGALMVRVGPDRWPIAMYKRDWQILLSKIPQIKKALENLDIPMDNPEREPGARKVA